jgi:hypothetical protein
VNKEWYALNDSTNQSTVALTVGQKLHLLGRVVPLVGFALMVIAYLVTINLGFFPPPSILFYAFIAVVFLFLGYQALQAIRDVLSGVAVVEEDILVRMRSSSASGNHLAGTFERLGTLRVPRKVGTSLTEHITYQVTYSPGSKVVWALEKSDLYSPTY